MALTLLHQPSIPFPTTSLVGRDADLARIIAMLADPATRLITLTGPGGVGKTRLALQVAHSVDPDSAGDIHFVTLAATADANHVFPTIAREIGVSQIGTLPLERAIAVAIGDRRMLMIVDNAEHVAEHLTPLAGLLASCRNLTILVTSRVMLRLSAEVVYPIEPLATTSDGASRIAPATMLFIERARAVRPDLPLAPADLVAIDEICSNLDGLPLAIELAAARTRFLSPPALRARLGERLQVLTGGPRDAPARHQTLRATLEWSHDLLGPTERTLFRRLAILENGAPYAAIGPICGEGIEADVEEALAALVDHSLVRVFDRAETGPRVRMLHTIRDFAMDQLVASGEFEAVARAHAAWFAELVMSTPATAWRTGTPELRESTLRLMPDVDNFAVMLPRLLDAGREADAVRVVAGLVPLWIELGLLRDARDWAQKVTPLFDTVLDSDRMHFLYMAATIAFASGAPDVARQHGEMALALSESSGDLRMKANTQNLLGQIAWFRGDTVEGERLQRAAIATSRSMGGTETGRALFSMLLALRIAEHGALDEAEMLMAEALPIIQRDRPEAMPMALGDRAYLHLLRGDLDQAATCLEASLAFHRESPYRQVYTLVERLVHAAWLASMRELDCEGARLYGAAEALGERIGLPVDSACTVGSGEVRRILQGRLEPDVFGAEISAGRALAVGASIALAVEVARYRAEPTAAPGEAERDTLGLTGRQLDVLRLLAEGKSNPGIAASLSISERTVTTHLTNIYDRLGVSTRTEAVAHATRLGLVGTPSL